MTDPFPYWAGIEPARSTSACEDLVPDWPSILEAAFLAHQGLHDDAELSRVRGDYGGLSEVVQ